MKYYPTRIFMVKWETNAYVKIGIRPDALADFCADICCVADQSSPIVQVSSVEHRGKDIASFLVKFDVPVSFYREIVEVIRRYESS